MSSELSDLRFPESRAESGTESKTDAFQNSAEDEKPKQLEDSNDDDPLSRDAGKSTPDFKTDNTPAGHVFITSDDMLTFQFGVLPETTDTDAEWVVIRLDGNPAVINPPPVTVRGGRREDGYDTLTVTLGAPQVEYLGRPMFIVLTDGTGSPGFASGVFSVVAGQGDAGDVRTKLQTYIDNDPSYRGGLTEANSPWNLPESGIPTTSTISGLTPTATDRSKDSSTDTTTGIGGSRGLSNGAKAGIGAGVGVVGLIIIGLAIWFFLRRRRRGRQAAGVAGDDTSLTPAAGFIHDDKDPHAARVADSPNSPVSDDERVRDSAIPAAEAGERSSAHAPSPTPEQPRDVPSAMAHLVEEGMTEAEIRRLEEEERALDQAIEQAGRR